MSLEQENISKNDLDFLMKQSSKLLKLERQKIEHYIYDDFDCCPCFFNEWCNQCQGSVKPIRCKSCKIFSFSEDCPICKSFIGSYYCGNENCNDYDCGNNKSRNKLISKSNLIVSFDDVETF
jgi:hypothetical protein